MTSSDYGQVTTILNRLRQVVESLNPLNVLATLEQVIHDVREPPPGDPDRIRALAQAYHTFAPKLTTLCGDIGVLANQQLPEVWTGLAGEKASDVIRATSTVVFQANLAMELAGRSLDEYAAIVEKLRARHADLHQRLNEAWHDATHVHVLGRDVEMVNPRHLAELVERAIELVVGCIEVYAISLNAAEELEGKLGDVYGRAHAQAARGDGGGAAGAVLLATTGLGTSPAGDNAILSLVQAQAAAEKLAGLSAADRAQMDALLAGAKSPEERAYLLKALAAGHSVGEISTFDARIRNQDATWLRSHLSLVDPGSVSSAYFNGALIKQTDDTTCGSASLVVAHSMVDPLYALGLTTGWPAEDKDTAADFSRRFGEEQVRLHEGTTDYWPDFIGTPPWGMTTVMNDNAAAFGTTYDWRLVDDTDSRSVNPSLADAVTAVDQGYPVPVMIGDTYPHHWVLMVGHDGDLLNLYEPSSGQIVQVKESDYLNGNLSAAGFHHVQGVVTPSR